MPFSPSSYISLPSVPPECQAPIPRVFAHVVPSYRRSPPPLNTLPISRPLFQGDFSTPFPGGPFLFFSYFLFVSSIVLLTVYKSVYFLSISIAWPSLSLLLLLLLPLSPECKLPEGRKVTNLFTSEPHRRECCLAHSRCSTKLGE